MEKTIIIKCETPDCPENGKVINEISGVEDEDAFMEAFGHGGECAEDYCPACKKLGVASC